MYKEESFLVLDTLKEVNFNVLIGKIIIILFMMCY